MFILEIFVVFRWLFFFRPKRSWKDTRRDWRMRSSNFRINSLLQRLDICSYTNRTRH